MPNHVEHDMAVTGTPEELARFKEFAQEGDNLLSANKFILYPQTWADMDNEMRAISGILDKDERATRLAAYRAKYGDNDGYNSGGYEWCISNWGTKWGMYNVQLVEHSSGLEYHFETAWSPAEPVYAKMSELFPELTFEIQYFECGMGFRGTYTGKDGILTGTSDDYSGDRGG